MDKKKFSGVVEDLKDLTSDFGFTETFKVKDFIANLIIAKARELVAIADEGKEKPQKSEMPCNCNCAEQTKTLQEIIDDAKSQLTDNQTYAAIVFRLDDTGTR